MEGPYLPILLCHHFFFPQKKKKKKKKKIIFPALPLFNLKIFRFFFFFFFFKKKLNFKLSIDLYKLYSLMIHPIFLSFD
jgi:hypothetical protein